MDIKEEGIYIGIPNEDIKNKTLVLLCRKELESGSGLVLATPGEGHAFRALSEVYEPDDKCMDKSPIAYLNPFNVNIDDRQFNLGTVGGGMSFRNKIKIVEENRKMIINTNKNTQY